MDVFSFKKAAQEMGVSEGRLIEIARAGTVTETSGGFIDAQSVKAWLQAKKDITTRANTARRDATESYEMGGRFARNRADREAQKHFEKELKDFSDSRWKKWNEGARKDLEKELGRIEAERLEALKELGVPQGEAGAK